MDVTHLRDDFYSLTILCGFPCIVNTLSLYNKHAYSIIATHTHTRTHTHTYTLIS